jgi:hypothetical protein
VNFAVLEGADVKFIDQAGPIVPALASAGEAESVLSQLAIAIRAHGHGGSLLIVPRHSHEWRESIIRPVTYSVMPPYSEISMLLKQEDPGPALRAAIEAIAGFTAVDGATIISEDFDLMAFGAKIMRRYGAERVQQVIFTEPIQGAVRIELDPSQLGGTRHLSAAQFVHDQRNTKALVASQDGRFTVFTWSDPDKSVLAHRIESLLI